MFIGGCWPGECHYITEGNYLTLSRVHLSKKMLNLMGVAPERVRLEYVSASEGSRFAEVVNDFSAEVRRLGPLGRGEGINENKLQFKLEQAQRLVPYIKLVEREKMRVPVKSEETYNRFFSSEEFEEQFQELIGDKFEISQMMAILREHPVSPGELSEMCDISPTDIARHLQNSTMQGLVTFDESRNLIATV